MIQSEENQEENSILTIFVSPLAGDRGQIQFCEN